MVGDCLFFDICLEILNANFFFFIIGIFDRMIYLIELSVDLTNQFGEGEIQVVADVFVFLLLVDKFV